MPRFAVYGASFTVLLALLAAPACSSREVVVMGAGPTAEQRAKMSPQEQIFDAAKRGDVVALRKLIAADPALVNVKDNQGQTPLHYTALCLNPDAVKLLIEKGADPLIKDLEERTPSYYASEMRAQPNVAKALGEATLDAAKKAKTSTE